MLSVVLTVESTEGPDAVTSVVVTFIDGPVLGAVTPLVVVSLVPGVGFCSDSTVVSGDLASRAR